MRVHLANHFNVIEVKRQTTQLLGNDAETVLAMIVVRQSHCAVVWWKPYKRSVARKSEMIHFRRRRSTLIGGSDKIDRLNCVLVFGARA